MLIDDENYLNTNVGLIKTLVVKPSLGIKPI